MKLIDKILVWISDWILVISGIGVCGLIFAGAVCRYVLKTDFYGSEELILLAAFWLYFFGSARAARNDTHIKAEMLGMFIKNEKVLAIANVLTKAVNFVMLILATIWSWQYLMWSIEMNMVSNVFRFPAFWPILPIFISFVVWLAYGLYELVISFKQVKEAGKEEKEAEK